MASNNDNTYHMGSDVELNGPFSFGIKGKNISQKCADICLTIATCAASIVMVAIAANIVSSSFGGGGEA